MTLEISPRHTFFSPDGKEQYAVDGAFDSRERKLFVWFRDNPSGDSHFFYYRDFPVVDASFSTRELAGFLIDDAIASDLRLSKSAIRKALSEILAPHSIQVI